MERSAGQRHPIPFNEQLQAQVEACVSGQKARSTSPAAVLVIHGMGQQVPFQTLDQVYQGLLRAERAAHKNPDLKLVATPVEEKVGETKVRRLEVRIGAATAKEPTRDVHLYEGYWAPLTEGKVTLRDVMAFLANGATNGLLKSSGKRQRWLFGRYKDVKVAGRIRLQLAAATLVLVGLVAMSTAATLGLASTATGEGMPYNAVSDLTWLALAIAAPAFLMGLVIAVSLLVKRSWRQDLATNPTPRPLRAAIPDALGHALFWFTVAMTCAVVILLAGVAVLWPFWHVDYNKQHILPLLPSWAPYIAWTLLAIVFGVARHALVQSLGDVAAFVNTHKVDRFNDVRSDIKKAVRDVAHAIYDAKGKDGKGKPSAEPRYSAVYLVGHSLGSVVAYSTLNDLIHEDIHKEPACQRDVLLRTRLLLTFGSPLAKTAFIYSRQSRKTTETREALAALVQPLIQDYRYRTMEWVNIHAKADIISGCLRAEYDDEEEARSSAAKMPALKGGLIDDKPDPNALTPLMAHNEYWVNPLVWTELRSRLLA